MFTYLSAFRAQELCESRGGRPGLLSLISLTMVSVDEKRLKRKRIGLLTPNSCVQSVCPSTVASGMVSDEPNRVSLITGWLGFIA